jgi:hypothetical protein
MKMCYVSTVATSPPSSSPLQYLSLYAPTLSHINLVQICDGVRPYRNAKCTFGNRNFDVLPIGMLAVDNLWCLVGFMDKYFV